ncbi:MAG: hypothetical protein M0P47_07835 [Bacteroidales bacterium]|nr:hypothetical protein [Bacteroidales bacterium]
MGTGKKNIISDSYWGGYFEPFQPKPSSKKGLRIALFGSTNAGHLVLDTLIRFERKNPNLLNFVGVATDDPLDPNTRINVGKRIWSKYDDEQTKALVDSMISSSLSAGIPCFTGDVKTQGFRRIFSDWDPGIIIMCCFGQKIDAHIYNYPVYGMFNFHPSDLVSNIGAGPRPFEATIQRGESKSFMALHKVNDIIDGGPIIGISPPVRICLENGEYPQNLLTMQEKIPAICGWMSIELILQTLRNMKQGLKKPVNEIDFASVIPEEVRKIMLKPPTNDLNEYYALPLHPELI